MTIPISYTLLTLHTQLEILEEMCVQDQGFKVIPWTVNEIHDMKRLIDWGVDGIITDYPDRCILLIYD